MREIDFLPEWYKTDRRRQFGYKLQYTVLGLIFAIMIIWNFVISSSVSNANASLALDQGKYEQAQELTSEFSNVVNEIKNLKENADILETADSKILISNVLAELSFLIDEDIVLRTITFKAEKLNSSYKNNLDNTRVRKAKVNTNKAGKMLGNIKFKIILKGIAVKPGDIAELICLLEDSPYFYQVIPSFSRNAEIKAKTGSNKKLQISEFEISCYLENYKID